MNGMCGENAFTIFFRCCSESERSSVSAPGSGSERRNLSAPGSGSERSSLMAFWFREVLPDVFHIEDSLGVCMTLICGSREALLADAGFGLENVAAFIAGLTDRPVHLILTHGHYDHILGAEWFPSAEIFEEDFPLVLEHGKRMWRERALEEAGRRGFGTDREAFLRRPWARAEDAGTTPVSGKTLATELKKLEEGDIDLGGLSVRVIRCPGHTPGSAVLYIPERELLLTGDDWNPCTWLFFPEALPVAKYRKNMQEVMKLPFRHVLCPHRRDLYDRSMTEDFVLGLTEENLSCAVPVDTGDWLGIHAIQAEPAPGQCLVFDRDKYLPADRNGK